jgi:hypothetical protein
MDDSGLSREALINEAHDLCDRAARASAEGEPLRARAYLDDAAALLDRTRLPDDHEGPRARPPLERAPGRWPPRRAPSSSNS